MGWVERGVGGGLKVQYSLEAGAGGLLLEYGEGGIVFLAASPVKYDTHIHTKIPVVF